VIGLKARTMPPKKNSFDASQLSALPKKSLAGTLYTTVATD